MNSCTGKLRLVRGRRYFARLYSGGFHAHCHGGFRRRDRIDAGIDCGRGQFRRRCDDLRTDRHGDDALRAADARFRGTLGPDAQEIARRTHEREAELTAEAAADTAETEAGCVVGTNATCAAASEAAQARHDARNAQYQAEDKPITDRMNTQMTNLAAQGQAMQNDPKLMHLRQLAQEKHCH